MGVRATRTHDPQDTSFAAHRHAVSQSDLRWHAEGEFDFCPLLKGSVDEEKDTTRTQILCDSDSSDIAYRFVDRDWEEVGKPLSNAAFDLNWRVHHRGIPR